ncbi:hypothetical protein AXK12_05555 [Cephaloticoccus capnophilus]|uniref:DUF4401 domain-containing protein n=1 Tax=Cephaloticoccus capnophilus TaxID=1548208 RepID=A0A139SL83_9BACT|nr:GDYXXLXY domain-containing protein [Cephaloticoccus capnophilus]KXU35313.1 hypothetical protein AXK12_05555 [Cephaloticoccus capnophilus]
MSPAEASPAPQAGSPHSSPAHSDARRWQLLGNRLLAFLGAALLAAALIFFFAYNWAELHRFAKFAVGFGAFLTAAAFALTSTGRRQNGAAPNLEARTARRRAALFAATLCIGALLALIGQVYQTGADLWELFALWALLVIPFALLARSVETWLLWLSVANTALILWLNQTEAFGRHTNALAGHLLCCVAFNTACLLLAERFARARPFTPNRALPRVAAFLALGELCVGACVGVFSEDFAHLIPLFIAAAVLMIALYRHYRFDLVMLAMSGSGAIAFGTVALARILRGIPLELSSILCASFLIVSSGLFIAWLIQLHRSQKPQSPDAKQPTRDALPIEASTAANQTSADPVTTPATAPTTTAPSPSKKEPAPPLWLSGLQGIAAWIAAAMLASSLATPFWLFEGGVWFIALAFIGGSIALFYKVRNLVFFDQAALALSFAGQALLYVSFSEHWNDLSDKGALTLSIIVALALFALRTTLLHRTLCLLWAITCLYLIVEPGYETHVLFGLGFSTLTILLWLGRPRWTAHKLGEYVLSLAHASSLIAWGLLGWNYFYNHVIFWKHPEAPHDFALLYSTVSAAILVGLVAWLCRPLYANADAPERAKKQAALLLCAAGLFAALAYRDPALVLCAALLLGTYAARERSWFTAMLGALPLLIWQLYYNMEQTLLMRALTLAGSGALLLGLRKAIALLALDNLTAPLRTEAVPLRRKETGDCALFGPFQRGTAAAAALVLALCLWGIWSNERVLAHGRPILVKLAPVDPRSLMQGDYMRLRYAIEHDLLLHMPQGWKRIPRSSYAYVVLDEQGRAITVHSIGSQLTPLPEGASLAVKLLGKPYSPSIAAKEFFFQEGRGEIYETAKWAELRVAPSGKALLLNLRDESLEILGETKR